MTEATAIQVQTRLPGLVVPEEEEKERVGSGLSGVTDYELTGGNSSAQERFGTGVIFDPIHTPAAHRLL
jgi:hypothetical protein